MPTTTQLVVTRPNVSNVPCLTLHASGLQPSDAPTAETVAQAINYAIRRKFWIPGEHKPVTGWPDAYTLAGEAIEAQGTFL